MYCTTCGSSAPPAARYRVSPIFEGIMWFCAIGLLIAFGRTVLFFVVIAALLSITRAATKTAVCASCRNATLIPVNTPVAARALRFERRG